MAVYQFSCDEHGAFELEARMGTAPRTLSCPDCSRQARRVFCAPMLSGLPRAVTDAAERAEGSGDEPRVVRSLPPRAERTPGGRYTRNPLHRRLPRT